LAAIGAPILPSPIKPIVAIRFVLPFSRISAAPFETAACGGSSG
jgi:hypothetical protein